MSPLVNVNHICFFQEMKGAKCINLAFNLKDVQLTTTEAY